MKKQSEGKEWDALESGTATKKQMSMVSRGTKRPKTMRPFTSGISYYKKRRMRCQRWWRRKKKQRKIGTRSDSAMALPTRMVGVSLMPLSACTLSMKASAFVMSTETFAFIAES